MVVGTTVFIIGALILLIWIFFETKRFNHKFWAILLIFIILFFFITFSFSIKGKNADLKSFSGIMSAGKIYFSWLGYAFGNVKSLTANAAKMNWNGNQTNSTKT